MGRKDLTAAAAVLEKFEDLFDSQTFEGIKAVDKNFEGNFLLIESSTRMYSFNSNDVLDEKKLAGGKVRVIMRKGCTGMITSPYRVGANDVTLLSHAENSPLPTPASKQKTLRL